MIAVEWKHELGNGTEPIRIGVILSTGMGTDQSDKWSPKQPVPCAFIITRRIDGDPFVKGHKRPIGDYPNILMSIALTKLIVKGVHIPFEPHGAEK